MPRLIRLLLQGALLSLACAAGQAAIGAEGNPGFAGHWVGTLSLPTGPLDIRTELVRAADGSWTGSGDVPAQGIRNFKLSVSVTREKVVFSMPNVPGEPTYAGQLSEDGTRITGDFTQHRARFGFVLRRTTAAEYKADVAIPAGIPGKGLVGDWLGLFKPTPNLSLRLALEVRDAEAERPDAAFISLDQQNGRMPIARVTEREGTIRLELLRPNTAFEGTFNRDGSELAGTFAQGSHVTPLVLRRQAGSVGPRRPQVPRKPYPYDEHDIRVEGPAAGVTLAGSLAVPRGAGPFPAVVLISGSGPQDRDGHVAGHRPFLVLADHLARAGIAVLRCDDRGHGRSTGNFAVALQADFVADTLACVAWLRTRPEIDPRRIGLVGHSEGAMVAPRAAAGSRDVAFIILLAGPGLPLEEIMLRQGAEVARVMGMTEEAIAQQVTLQREMLRILRSEASEAEARAAVQNVLDAARGDLTEEQRKAVGLPKAGAQNPMPGLAGSPWLRDALRIDPQTALRAVTCPVLALTGEKDLQVAARENLAAIESALRAGGNPRFKTRELPGLNHLFQTCATGAPYEYPMIEETFSPSALEEISRWILETASPAQ